MQGVVLSVRTAQSLILGDDGVRYTFTPDEWQNSNIGPQVGMRVDYEVRGSDAVDIFPIPGTVPAPPAQPPAAPPATSGVPPAQPPTPPTKERKLSLKGWHWALAGGGALIVLGIVGAFVLGIFPTFGSPVGREIARHTHQGEVYTLVEYGDELAIFSGSGAPVEEHGLAEDLLRSYAWRQAIGEFDTGELTEVSRKVRTLDDSVSGVRGYSNDVVAILYELDSLEANLPFVGSISAMDVIRDSFTGVDEAESLIRSLYSELNDLGDNAATLARTSDRIRDVDLSSVSGDEMESLFSKTTAAARDLESSVRSVKDGVSAARESVGDLADALRGASDTPIIGGVLGDFARDVGGFESELSGLSSLLGGFESELEALGEDTQAALDSADQTLEADMERWLAEPYDTEWPPADPDRRPAGVAPPPVERGQTSVPPVGQGDVARQAVVSSQANFRLEWQTSASTVAAGDSFTLTVRMYGLEEAWEHGGISVSFPLLTESGGSKESHSAPAADVEALDYTSGLPQVAFHQPGATIYHRENNRQFPAEYLLVESDDPSWSNSDDRTLRLRITPKAAGEFPVQIRGWLCAEGYTNCSRSPDTAEATDQQGWAVEVVYVSVTKPLASAVTPTQRPAEESAQPPESTAALEASMTIVADSFTKQPSPEWLLLGSAQHNPSGFIQLTPTEQEQLGFLVYGHKLPLNQFRVDFSFEIGKGSGADGMAFFVTRTIPPNLNPSSLHGELGGMFGSQWLDGYGIEFDTFLSPEFSDPSANHVGVSAFGERWPRTLAATHLEWSLRNNGIFEANVLAENGQIRVYLSNPNVGLQRTLILEYEIPTYAPFEGYFGFLGITGGAHDRHVIHSVRFETGEPTAFPPPATPAHTPTPTPMPEGHAPTSEEAGISYVYEGFHVFWSPLNEYGDFNAECKSQVGDEYRLADWSDLKSWVSAGGSIPELIAGLRLAKDGVPASIYPHDGAEINGGHPKVSWNGRWNDGRRHYFISRHDHVLPGYFLAHDNIDNHHISLGSLGSWYGEGGTVLCYNPMSTSQSSATPEEAGISYVYEGFHVFWSPLNEYGDFNAECKSQVGDEYRLADWSDLKSWVSAGGSIPELIAGLRLAKEGAPASIYPHDGAEINGGHPKVSWNGRERWNDGRRHFFISRHDHVLPGYFLAHDDIDNHHISLGSWYGEGGTVLCYNPMSTSQSSATPEEAGISYVYEGFHVFWSPLNEYGDFNAECKSQVGDEYRLADWSDLKSWVSAGGSIPELIAGLRLAKDGVPASIYPHDGAEINGGHPKVSWNGRWNDGRRHYFISRHDHVLPGYFLAHDNIDNHHISLGSLGSWYGEGGTVLCYNPMSTSQSSATPEEAGISYVYEGFHVFWSPLNEYGDFNAECKSQVGDEYRLADWSDLKSWVSAGGSIPELIAGLRLAKEGAPASIYPHDGAEINGGHPKVSWNGRERWNDGRRHYFISRHDHVLPGYFLAHDDIDNHHISLGSWYGEGGTVLCYNPMSTSQSSATPEEAGISYVYEGFHVFWSPLNEYGDFNAECKSQVGDEYRLADWSDLKSWVSAGGSIPELIAGLRLAKDGVPASIYPHDGAEINGGHPKVSWNGRWNDGRRHYFISRHDHVLPGYFLAHDNIDNHHISLGSLGSWYGEGGTVLCYNPMSTSQGVRWRLYSRTDSRAPPGGSIPAKEGAPASIYPHDGAEINGGHPKVSWNGRERWNDGRRHFFISRHDHVLPGYFLAHDDIDNHHISLGSWYGEGGTVLCYNPMSTSQSSATPALPPTSTPVPAATPVPPSGRIAFTSNRDDPDLNDDERVENIYVMNADGSGVTRLTADRASNNNPSWSPDGKRIAFTSFRDGYRAIYVMNVDGSGVTPLINDRELRGGGPSWSPDGRRIAFDAYWSNPDASDDEGGWSIYVMNADGSGVTRLTNNRGLNGAPSW